MAVFHQATVVVSAATSGAQAWVPLDQKCKPFDTSFFVTKIGTGDNVYRVEHTPINMLAPTSGAEVSANIVFTHEDVSANSTPADGNYAFPVAAIRLFVIGTASMSGQSSLRFTVIQGGP